MSGLPRVSVVMAVYNGQRHLAQAVDSILDQTFGDFEFLIIDDGSTDSSAQIIKAYDDPRIVLVRNDKNMGQTPSLNKGIRLARGEYIARMDADDVSIHERLERQVNYLNNNRATGLVGTHYIVIDEGGRVLHELRPPHDTKVLKQRLLMQNQFAHGSVLFRRDCIEKVGYYREEFIIAQDYDLWLRIVDCFDVANIPAILYKWRFDLKSLSLNGLSQSQIEGALAIELAKERRQFRTDRLQVSEKSRKRILRDMYSNAKCKGKWKISQGYCHWSRILLKTNNYSGGLKLLVQGFAIDPLNIRNWAAIGKSMILFLFPKLCADLLRSVRGLLARR